MLFFEQFIKLHYFWVVKKKFRPYIIMLLGFFLVSVIGFTVYKDACKMKGNTISLFTATMDCCNSMQSNVNKSMSHMACCGVKNHRLKGNIQQISTDCCSHQTTWVKAQQDLVNQDIRVQLPIISIIMSWKGLKFEAIQTKKITNYIEDPPLPLKKPHLSQLQMFLI